MTLAIPDVPDNVYHLLVKAANAVDTANDSIKRSASRLNGMQGDTNKAVNNVLTNSHGLTTDALGDIWTSSQVDFGVASGALSAYTSKNCMGGSPTPLRAALEANGAAIQNGVLAIERRRAFRRTATPQQLSFEDTVEDMMQSMYLERSLGIESILAALTPAVEGLILSIPGLSHTLLRAIVEWTMDIQEMESALSNIALALEVMLIGLNNLNNNGFSPGTCATGFVPGGPLPLFPTRAFLMQKSGDDNGGKGGITPDDLENYIESNTNADRETAAFIVMYAEDLGLNLDDIKALIDAGADPNEVLSLLESGKITSSNLNDITLLLNRGGGDVTQIADRLQGLNDNQLAILRNRAAQSPKMSADDLLQLADPELKYEPNPKHDVPRPGVGPQPVNGQLALNNSVSYKPTTLSRVGIDPDTGDIVVFDYTNDGTYHGHIETWQQLDQDQKNALYNDGFVDRSTGRIILRDAQGNIIGKGNRVPGWRR